MPKPPVIGPPLQNHGLPRPPSPGLHPNPGVVSVRDFGATGTYRVPAPGAPVPSADDTHAFELALASGALAIFIPPGVYRLTRRLIIPNGVHLYGAGDLASLLWVELPADAAEHFLHLGPSDGVGRNIQLDGFGIVGGPAPGRRALTSRGLWDSTIDISVLGGWEHVWYMYRQAEGIEGEQGGIEEVDLTLRCTTLVGTALPAAQVGFPKAGLYIRGWANASRIYMNVAGVTMTGDAVHLDGTYGAANSCTISGVYQGVGGLACRITGAGGGMWIRDFYCERGNQPALHGLSEPASILFDGDIVAPHIGPNVSGHLLFQRCHSPTVTGHNGIVHVTASVKDAVIIQGASGDEQALVNDSTSTVTQSWHYIAQASFRWAFPGVAVTDTTNLLHDGEFSRWVPAVEPSPIRPWGVHTDGIVVRRCGGGPLGGGTGAEADPTRTSGARYCMRVESLGADYTSVSWLVDGDRLAGQEGMSLVFSFKWRSVSTIAPGRPTANAADAGGEWGAIGPVLSGPLVEHCFRRHVMAFRVTRAMIETGLRVSIQFAEHPLYISEVMLQPGLAASREYVPGSARIVRPPTVSGARGAEVTLTNGRLELYTPSSPSARDPIWEQPCVPGDRAWCSDPVEGAPAGWVYTTAGWRPFGLIA